MKPSNLIMKIIMGVLLVGVVTYFAIYLFRGYQGGVTTVAVYEDSVDLGVETTGVVVREETVLTSSAAATHLVELIPGEGEKVASGGTVAMLYASDNGLEVSRSITALENEIQQLKYILNNSGKNESAAKLDAQVLDAIAALRASAALGDLSDLENDTLELRTLVFKRDFTYGDTNAAQAVSELIQEKTKQLTALRASLGGVSTTLYAPRSGVFSGLVDGLESVLTPAVLDGLSPSGLTALLDRADAPANAVGKLITAATWYFAAVMTEAEAEGFRESGTYTVQFSRDWSGQADMTLERVSDPEDGQVLLVFSCRTNLADTTLLRRQTVEVVTETVTGLRVPRQALRTVTETVTNEDGTTEEVTTLGVYVLVGAAAEFKEVRVLWQDDDTFLVEPVINGTSAAAQARRLQEGDEVILSTKGLYDGKVVR